MTTPRRLERVLYGAPAEPVRIAHLGLGAFHRSHEAWYTDRANRLSPDRWGIAAFTGRRPDEALKLAPQDGLYTLVTRAPDEDSALVVQALSEVHDGQDVAAWLRTTAMPSVAIVSLTVTEAGYCLDANGELDTDAPGVPEDLELASRDTPRTARTVPGRLVQALRARQRAGSGALAVLSCDNLAGNGESTRRVVATFARLVDPRLADWIDEHVAFPSTMVDRITPRSTGTDRELAARLTGWADASPVVTEPFSEWVIEDGFPAGRPDWAAAGAVLTDDVQPYEQRKLLVLNGGHSLLAYLGLLRGHETVDEAVADPMCQHWLERWWDEAAQCLELAGPSLLEYRRSVLARWGNPRIRHHLRQIATDGSLKLPRRVVPVVRRLLSAGEAAPAGVTALGAWVGYLHADPDAADADPAVTGLAQLPLGAATPELLRRIAPDLGQDAAVVAQVLHSARNLDTAQELS